MRQYATQRAPETWASGTGRRPSARNESQKRLNRAFGAEAHYTRAYASYEKGAARELQPPRQETVSEGD